MTQECAWTLLNVNEAAQLLGLTPRAVKKRLQNRQFNTHQMLVDGNGGPQYRISINWPGFPAEARTRWIAAHSPQTVPAPTPVAMPTDVETDVIAAIEIPARDKEYCSHWHYHLSMSQSLRGIALQEYCRQNNIDFSTLYRKRQSWEAGGRTPQALIRSYKSPVKGKFKADSELYKIFASHYLTERRPSVQEAYKIALGTAAKQDGFQLASFPSHMSFYRRLCAEVPDHLQYRFRYGETRYRAKYGWHIQRDYSTIMAGQVWVSDHAQSDVKVRFADGTVGFPWYTPWIDVKTQKWLGWIIHAEKPNSDHILAAFERAGSRYGIPRDVILDNGKDYLAKTVAGGRQKVDITIDEPHCMSLMARLNITAHFAHPYNAQAKIIERRFSIVNAMFARHCAGYRGPNVTQKPEEQPSPGELMSYDDYCKRFTVFIEEVLNREQSSGVLKGKCPDQVWQEEYQQAIDKGIIRKVLRESLALFCMKASGEYTIKGNGIYYRPLDTWYFSEWMVPLIGTRVYMRMPWDDATASAYVIDAETDQLLGVAQQSLRPSAMAYTDAEKVTLREACAMQRRIEQSVKTMATVPDAPQVDWLEARIRANQVLNDASGFEPVSGTPEAKTIQITTVDQDVKRIKSEKPTAAAKKRTSSNNFFSRYAEESGMLEGIASAG